MKFEDESTNPINIVEIKELIKQKALDRFNDEFIN